MKCILVSFFNSHNLGDCIISDTLYKGISSKYNTERYSYINSSSDFTDINNIKSLYLKKNNSRKEYLYKILQKYNLKIFLYLYRSLKRKNKNFEEFENKIRNADALIIGGGNMIFDLNKYSESALHFNKFITIAKKYKIKVFVISVGIGPFVTRKQEKKAIKVLEKCDYITFRDQKSYDIYKKYSHNIKKAYVSVDPVFLLPYSIEPSPSKDMIFGFNVFNSKLIGDDEDEYNSLINSYVKLANRLIDELNVKIILFSTDLTDYKTVYDVYDKLSHNKNIQVREIRGFNELIDIYGEISILIGTRMHSMIIAFTQHVPIIGLSWQQKVDAMFDIIDSKDCLYKYNKIENNLDSIIYCCKKKMNNLELERTKIIEKLSIIKQKWEINSEIINKIEQEIFKEINF